MPDVVLSLRKEVEAAADASAQRAALVASLATQAEEMARALLGPGFKLAEELAARAVFHLWQAVITLSSRLS